MGHASARQYTKISFTSAAILAVLVAALFACGGTGAGAGPTPALGAADQGGATTSGGTPVAAAEAGPRSAILASGEFILPAAGAFGEPGFHQVLTAIRDVPGDVGSTAGLKLVVRLRDAGRPEQTCSRDHPLSGCATVDWSDSSSRPKVPPGGVFDNSLTLQLSSGPRKLYLSEAGTLKDGPDKYDPT